MEDPLKNSKTAALLLGHGSRAKEANENMSRVVRLIREKDIFLAVEAAFLELSPPSIPQGIEACVAKGAEKIIIAPYFLHAGMHVKRDLPKAIQEEAQKYPDVKMTYAGNIGFHPVLADIVLERLREASAFDDIRTKKIDSVEKIIEAKKNSEPEKMETGKETNFLKPGEIESESFKIILKELGEHHLNSFELPVVQRVIHTSADFDLAKCVYFHPRFFESVWAAVHASKALITDVNMALAGTNRKLLDKFGMSIRCFVSDDEVSLESARTGKTRSSLGIRKGAASMENTGGILVGNAPTALREVIRLHREEGFDPGFVIAAPVGFVDAEESKEAFVQSDIPGVVIRGRKGGSPVAAAILNAVLMLVEKHGKKIVEGDTKR